MAAGIYGESVQPVVLTADATAKASEGYVHWITISNIHATESTAVEIADDATDRWGVTVETSLDRDVLPFHAEFDPPIHCKTSVLIDITGGTVKVTVGVT